MNHTITPKVNLLQLLLRWERADAGAVIAAGVLARQTAARRQRVADNCLVLHVRRRIRRQAAIAKPPPRAKAKLIGAVIAIARVV